MRRRSSTVWSDNTFAYLVSKGFGCVAFIGNEDDGKLIRCGGKPPNCPLGGQPLCETHCRAIVKALVLENGKDWYRAR